MFSSLSNSWTLVKAAWKVLQLFVFPVVSTIAALPVTAAFAIPGFLLVSSSSSGTSVAGYVVLFLFYLVMNFVVIFANAALIGAALIRLRGGNPTLSDGFGIARSHVGAIFAD